MVSEFDIAVTFWFGVCASGLGLSGRNFIMVNKFNRVQIFNVDATECPAQESFWYFKHFLWSTFEIKGQTKICPNYKFTMDIWFV